MYKLAEDIGSKKYGIYECTCGVRMKLPHRDAAKNKRGCRACWKRRKAEVAIYRDPAYSCWEAMVARCCNPANAEYARYARNGISVADVWRGPGGSRAFLEHIGPRPSRRHSIDRIDNTKGYFPGNVRWATATEQGLNRENTVRYVIGGIEKALTEWCAEYRVVSAPMAYTRIAAGWDVLRAVSSPSTRGKTADGAERRALSGAIQRCQNPNNSRYPAYGGRGITVDPAWCGIGGIERFIAYIGLRPTVNHSLDRIDNDGPYAPGNVRWVLPEEQHRNRQNAIILEYEGQTLCLSEWARQKGLSPTTLARRVHKGWSVERILAPSWYSRSPEISNALPKPKCSPLTASPPSSLRVVAYAKPSKNASRR